MPQRILRDSGMSKSGGCWQKSPSVVLMHADELYPKEEIGSLWQHRSAQASSFRKRFAPCLRGNLAVQVACALYEAAVAKYEAVLEMDPQNRAILRNCAFAMYDLGRLQPDPASRTARQLLEVRVCCRHCQFSQIIDACSADNQTPGMSLPLLAAKAPDVTPFLFAAGCSSVLPGRAHAW